MRWNQARRRADPSGDYELLGHIIVKIPPKLKEYIDSNRGSLPPITNPDEPLQIDSLGLIRLVAFLESELGYRVKDEELIIENFATLRTLGELLATKLQARS